MVFLAFTYTFDILVSLTLEIWSQILMFLPEASIIQT